MIDLIDRSPTLPALLAERGYRSFQSGKWWLGDFARGGFTHGMTPRRSAQQGCGRCGSRPQELPAAGGGILETRRCHHALITPWAGGSAATSVGQGDF